MIKNFTELSIDQQTQFYEALHFLHVDELKALCEQLQLPITGKKGDLIQRVFHFLQNDEIILIPVIPKSSCAQRGVTYPLHPTTLILKGSYKNDLKTRLFFKQLVGPHFHFTAFGIDWINQRWLQGTPPTYQEFTTMWHDQYEKRKQSGSTPKGEWRYIRFTQWYLSEFPNASRMMLINAWNQERAKQKEFVNEVIKQLKC